jgi:hypothetical protein
MPKSRYLAISAIGVAGLFLAGCGGSVVPAAEVEGLARQQLAELVGLPVEEAPELTCPGDLDAEVGAVVTCTIPLPGGIYDVAVTVTSVEGGEANLSIVVADEPN